jgi:hypothetical protein
MRRARLVRRPGWWRRHGLVRERAERRLQGCAELRCEIHVAVAGTGGAEERGRTGGRGEEARARPLRGLLDAQRAHELGRVHAQRDVPHRRGCAQQVRSDAQGGSGAGGPHAGSSAGCTRSGGAGSRAGRAAVRVSTAGRATLQSPTCMSSASSGVGAGVGGSRLRPGPSTPGSAHGSAPGGGGTRRAAQKPWASYGGGGGGGDAGIVDSIIAGERRDGARQTPPDLAPAATRRWSACCST